MLLPIFDDIFSNMGGKKSLIKNSFRQLLGAIIRLAIRNGLNYLEFSAICKSLYVDIATKEFGIKGRETNISRVSLMTGLDRKEIKSIRELKEKDVDNSGKRPDKLASVLSHWFDGRDYIDEQGRPIELPFTGEGISFDQLVHSAGGGSLAPITVLREFKRSKVVEETESGLLRVLKRDYIPNYHANADLSPEFVDPDAISHGSSMLVDHINTIFHNLYREDMKQSAHLDMRATDPSVKLSKVPEFYKLVDDLGMDLLDQIDEWLEENSVKDVGDGAESSIRLGVGVYSIEGQNTTVEKKS